jgi:hypothetical protein
MPSPFAFGESVPHIERLSHYGGAEILLARLFVTSAPPSDPCPVRLKIIEQGDGFEQIALLQRRGLVVPGQEQFER